MTKIADAFNHGKAFIPFITCGDPDLATTAKLVRAAADSGADLIELGIPFSDPTAEGPVIQEASERALKAGTTTDKVFDLVRDLRTELTLPMVFMTYANVVFLRNRPFSRKRSVGIQGLILPDVPFEEKEEFGPACRRHGLDSLADCPDLGRADRKDSREASVHLLCFLVGGYGGPRRDHHRIGAMVRLVKRERDIPCAVGFGISTPSKLAGWRLPSTVSSSVRRL